jgi:hypothetical protein
MLGQLMNPPTVSVRNPDSITTTGAGVITGAASAGGVVTGAASAGGVVTGAASVDMFKKPN